MGIFSTNDSNIMQPAIDLERSELRYIFYSFNLNDLFQDFIDLGFQKKIYENTPITKTIYFGSKIGLKPGLSVKARIYSSKYEENICQFNPSSIFNILEIKSTVNQDDFLFHGIMEPNENGRQRLINELAGQLSKDILFRIQRASEDGILRDSTLKTKSKLDNVDLFNQSFHSNLTLKQIVSILSKSSSLDDNLSNDLKTILNNKIRPLFFKNLYPYVMTQYSRIHLIPMDSTWRNFIRVTVDPGVEYYEIEFDEPNNYMDNPSLTGEYLLREKFCRLEFKIDPIQIKNQKHLEKAISEILRKYGCIAYISKKWSGATLVSERHIEKQSLWKEPLGVQISGFFPVDPSWYAYGQITEELFNILRESKNFSINEAQPRILIKNHNHVTGYLGVPIPSMVIIVDGPIITYNLPSKGHLVKLVKNQPEFYIMEEQEKPVRSILISSKKELDNALHPAINIEGYTFFRSYGFLVENIKSHRIYKLTIERKLDAKGSAQNLEFYCKLRYIGNKLGYNYVDKQEIFKELGAFYDEFAPIMALPVDIDTFEGDFSNSVLDTIGEELKKRGE